MLRNGRLVVACAAAAVLVLLAGCGCSTMFDGVMNAVSPYVEFVSRARAKSPERSIVFIKLGMGIPYCRGHAVGLALREGRQFRVVAAATSLRGIGVRHIGLMAAEVPPGSYHIVHSQCHVNGRRYRVAKQVEPGRRPRNGRAAPLFQKSYAAIAVGRGETIDAGWLRFWPRGNDRDPRRVVEAIPRADISFLKRRYGGLSAGLMTRRMRLTNPNGTIPDMRPAVKTKPTTPVRPKTPVAIVPKAKPKQKPPAAPAVRPPPVAPVSTVPPKPVPPPAVKPKIIAPAKPIPAPAEPASGAPAADSGSMTAKQRAAACEALRELKRDGKIEQMPLTCLQLQLPRGGLPPAIGPDK